VAEKRPIFSRYCKGGEITLYPEARELLDLLAPTDHVLTIASGTVVPDIEAILDHAGLRERFTEILGSDVVPVLKPAPDILHAMMDRVGCDAFECVLIEDAEKGVFAAVAVHMPVIVIRTEETRDFDFSMADLVFDSHAEMIETARAVLAPR
jgi:HAD superfamily hydrolase (TIGR01509 family)